MIGDELAETVAMFRNFDAIVLATPLYWMSYPAQLKMLIDRMGSQMKYNEHAEIRTPLTGKTLALLSTCNGPLENNMELLDQQWGSVAYHLSCRFKSCLFPKVPTEIGSLVNDPSVLERASEFGRQLVS